MSLRLLTLQGLPTEAPELGADVVVTSEDAMEPAGTCLSVLEGMVVMQGLPNSRPLADGWVRTEGQAAG